MRRRCVVCIVLSACTGYHDFKLGSLPPGDAAMPDASVDAGRSEEHEDDEDDDQQGEHENP